jgi:hypothetical protein
MEKKTEQIKKINLPILIVELKESHDVAFDSLPQSLGPVNDHTKTKTEI